MAYEIIWTSEADNDFKNIIIYLKENWSLLSAEKFVENTYKKIEKLANNPSLARHTSKQSILLYRLDRKNVVFFTIEHDFLILLSIYPYKMDISKSRYF